jgi:hypothetical protein
MDLTKFSTDDLMALQSGDLSKVSTPGLKILKSQQLGDKLVRDNPGEYDPNSPEFKARHDPTNGMSGPQKFLAGAGKAYTDIGRGVGQLIRNVIPDKAADYMGLPTQAEIDEAKRLDTPLMKTGAGVAGNITGNVVLAAPTAFIPGAATLPGAAAVGAGMGFIQPVASDESRLKNTAIGGAAGAGGVALGRVVKAGYQGAKSLAEPFTEAGRQSIAGRTLQRFGVEAGDLVGATSAPTVTGARTTLAEQIARPEGAAGAARLQDAMRAVDPEIAAQMAAREAENNAARVGTLQQLAGQDGSRDFAEAMRNTAAKDLYQKAFDVKLAPNMLTPSERGEITKLMKVPAIQDAMTAAKEIAANSGINITKPEGSIQGLHLMKLALDDAVNSAASQQGAAAVNKAMSIKTARDRLLTFIERMAPEYGEARATYAAMSKPLNQADVASEVLKRGTSATTDLAGNVRLMPNSLANSMRDEGKLIKQATGRDLGTTKLSDLLEPDQLAKLTAVAKEVDRSAAVARAANGPGSATAQRLASQNILQQIIGPTGLPKSWAESTLLNTAMRPVQFAYSGVAEPKIQMTLADLLLNPDKAAKAMAAATPAQRSQLAKVLDNPQLQQAARAALPAATVAGQR